MTLKYKTGNKVRIKSIDWYNKNKNTDGSVHCGDRVFDNYMSVFCGSVVTIGGMCSRGYSIREDMHCRIWTDEMIEGLADETEIAQDAKTFSEGYVQGYEDGQHDMNEWILPEGFKFTDENGNVINATKIVLEKKKKEYPKTYDKCCEVLGIGSYFEPEIRNATTEECHKFTKLMRLKRCRDAYWKLYGEEMGLGKPWEPTHKDSVFSISRIYGKIITECHLGECVIFEFPTPEMRDAFCDNFDPDIEICKELL